MKFFKSSILAVAALSAFAFASCGEDDQYNPGNPSDGLFFEASTLDVTLPIAESTASVDVYRAGITQAATYKINVVSEDSEFFVFPSEVTFDEGANSAKISFTYNAGNLTEGEEYTVELSLGEDVPVCSYGSDRTTLVLSLQEDLTDWKPLGDGTCNYLYLTGFWTMEDDPGLPISYRYNNNTPNNWEVMVEHWCNDVPLTIYLNAETGVCHLPLFQETGVTSNGEMIYQTDAATLFSVLSGDQWAVAAQNYMNASTYDKEKGVFKLLVVYFTISDEGSIGYWSGDVEGFFGGYDQILVDGFPDYSASMTYEGAMISADGRASYAMVGYTLGSDADKLVMLASANATQNDLYNAIVSDDPLCTTVTDASGVAQVQLDGKGKYTLVGVTFEGDEPQQTVAITFNVTTDVPENLNIHWPVVGSAIFVDGWIIPAIASNEELEDIAGENADGLMTTESMYWTVTVRESATTPGLYRLESPWTSEECPIASLNANTEATDIFIDATNPDVVKLLAQYSGFSDTRGRDYYISNYAGTTTGAGKTDEELAANANNTIFDDGYIVITPSYYAFTPSISTRGTYKSYEGINFSSIIQMELVSSTRQVAPRKGNFAPKSFFQKKNDVIRINR